MNQYPAQWISPRETRIEGGVFGPILQGVREKMLPYQWKVLNDEIPGIEKSHCIENFRIAAGKSDGEFYGFVFQDSDLGKWLEAVSYSLMACPDPGLEKTADDAVEIMAAAQQPDGYLDTYFICTGLDKRFTNLRDCHELYCAGHLLEGAIAYYRATGKTRALDVLRKYIDYIDTIFGPEDGKCHGYPGHPEIELALCSLYDVTGEKKYLRLASFFIEERGKKPNYFVEEQKKLGREFYPNGAYGLMYAQSHLPVREQHSMEGHAVRALYLASGMTDVALRTGDHALFNACRELFFSVYHRRMYITGGVGSTYIGEAFTFDYDLPPDRAYAETCASVALVFFAARLLRGELKGEYADAMEQALYNTCLSGMSLDQTRYFYVNALSVWPEADEKDPGKKHVVPERQPWLACACCPPNLARMLSALSTYAVSVPAGMAAVHLYVSGTYQMEILGKPATLTIETDYPRSGHISIQFQGEGGLALHLPAWCSEWSLLCDGKSVSVRSEDGYLYLEGPFHGECVELDLVMAPERVYACSKVRDYVGQTAIRRGPVVYCAEEADNGNDLHLIRIPREAAFQLGEGLAGWYAIETDGYRVYREDERLYSPNTAERTERQKIRLVPYCVWGNRGKGEMRVFLHES